MENDTVDNKDEFVQQLKANNLLLQDIVKRISRIERVLGIKSEAHGQGSSFLNGNPKPLNNNSSVVDLTEERESKRAKTKHPSNSFNENINNNNNAASVRLDIEEEVSITTTAATAPLLASQERAPAIEMQIPPSMLATWQLKIERESEPTNQHCLEVKFDKRTKGPTILQLRQAIGAQLGISPPNQRLYVKREGTYKHGFGFPEIGKVNDLQGLVNGSTLIVKERVRNPFPISVRIPSGGTYGIMVDSEDLVAELKILVKEHEGTDENLQRLIFAGRPLQDDWTLSACRITQNVTVHMFPKGN